MADPLGGEAREDDRRDEGPRGREEPEPDAHLPLDREYDEENADPDAPRDVPRAPGKCRFGRAEPDGVDPVDLVVSADPHVSASDEQAGEPLADVRPRVGGDREADDGQ